MKNIEISSTDLKNRMMYIESLTIGVPTPIYSEWLRYRIVEVRNEKINKLLNDERQGK